MGRVIPLYPEKHKKLSPSSHLPADMQRLKAGLQSDLSEMIDKLFQHAFSEKTAKGSSHPTVRRKGNTARIFPQTDKNGDKAGFCQICGKCYCDPKERTKGLSRSRASKGKKSQ